MRFQAALFLVGLLCASAEAQTPDAQVSGSFGERVEVELVNLRVWVEDSKGRPVADLGPEEFRLEIDGEPVAFTHFAEVRGAASKDTGELESIPEPRQPAAVAEEPVSVRDEEAWLVIYIDESHLGFSGRKRVLSDLQDLVAEATVDPARILVLRQATELQSVAAFGSGPTRLLEAIDSLAEPPPGLSGPAEKQQVIQRLWQEWEEARQFDTRGDPCPLFVRPALMEIGVYARRARRRTETTARYLGDVSQSLGGVAGVKTLLYVGDQLDIQPGIDLLGIVQGLCPLEASAAPSNIASEELSDLFEDLTLGANASRLTLYTLQAKGLETGLSGPEQQVTNPRAQSSFERQLRQAERTGLRELAARTGGKAFTGRNRFGKELRAMARDLGTYYSLGFPLPESVKGARHRVEVRLRDRKMRPRYRRELRRKSERERLEEQVVSTILIGETPNLLGVRLASGSVKVAGPGALTVPLHVRVPVDQITYLPTAEGERASLEILVTARGPQLAEPPRWVRIFRFLKPEETSGLVDLVVELELPQGIHTLGVGVKDEATGEASFVSTTVELWGENRPAGS